jgi:type III secretion protein J
MRLKKLKTIVGIFCLLLLAGCETHETIVHDMNERDANEIMVFLKSKGIEAQKVQSSTAAPVGGAAAVMWSISVSPSDALDAMAILNQNGLPRKQGTNLLELFAKQGLMSTEKEETIRYQAGLEQEIGNTIRKIDGVIDAEVKLSIPAPESGIPGMSQTLKRVTAAVYVKHQGVLDDPNSHLVAKIKRLVSGSVNNLDVNDVTVISDRSRFTDITLEPTTEALTAEAKQYVNIWSVVMSKSSASRFRFLFFTLTFACILFALLTAWMIWKFYPVLRKAGGFKQLFHPKPIQLPLEHSEEDLNS